MDFLIVGGGIGGLTLAAALKGRGIASEVIERAPAFAPVGAGIVLGLNAMKVLDRVGVGDAVRERGRAVAVARIAEAGGRTLSAIDFREMPADIGRPIAIHRAALHEALLTGVDRESVRLDTTLKALRPSAGKVDAAFSDGRSDTYDAAIGADGIRSQVRQLVFGEAPLRYSGYTCWRFVVHGEVAETDTWEIWGRGRRFGIVPIGKDTIYCFATLNAPRDDASKRDVALDDFKALYADFGGPVPGILAELKRADALIWNDLEEVRIPRWTSGPVGLLGDAAHALTPNLGQGAAMAIEDAYVLARRLATADTVERALAAYEAARRPRVEMIQQRSWRIGQIAQWESRAGCFLRNTLVRFTPERTARRGLEAIAKIDLD